MLKPRTTSKTGKTLSLETLTASMVGLYLLAKSYHLNTTGRGFYGDHKTFDGIADMATEWYDTLAERMRTLDMHVVSSITWVLQESIIQDAEQGVPPERMLADMLGALDELSAFINTKMNDVDPTTQNMVQELDAAIGKQIYFVRSSM